MPSAAAKPPAIQKQAREEARGTKPSSHPSSVRLRKLELFLGLKPSKARDQVLSAIGKAVPPLKEAGPKRISASVLPQADEAEHYAHFHIDDYRGTDEGKQNPLFVHVTYRRQPSTVPPKPFLDLKKKNITVEWFDEQLRLLVGTGKPFVMFEAEGVIAKAEKRPVVAAPPLTVESTLLQCTGVEYSSEIGELGLNRFRWSRKPDKESDSLDVFFAYSQQEAWQPVNPWLEEAERCTKFFSLLT